MSDSVKLDFIIPASLTAGFLSQIAFFRMALDHHGGIYRDARVVAVFGDYDTPCLPHGWGPYFDRIETVWAHEPGTPNPMYLKQHYKRFECIRNDADLVCLCDADVAILKPFTELVENVQRRPAVCGVQAHYHFSDKDPVDEWSFVFKKIANEEFVPKYKYTLRDSLNEFEAPFYVNYGFFAGPPDLIQPLGCVEQRMNEKVERLVGQFFGPQVSLALAIASARVEVVALPMKYNFPNDRKADLLYPEEMADVRVMHYLRRGDSFDRQLIFSSEEYFDAFLRADFQGSDRIFQSFVKSVTRSVYPFRLL